MRKFIIAAAGAAALAFSGAASAAVTVSGVTNLSFPNPQTSIFNSNGITTIFFGQPTITGPSYNGGFTFQNDVAGMYSIVVGSSTTGFVWDLTKTLLTGDGNTYTFTAAANDPKQLSLTLGTILLAANTPYTLTLSGTAPSGSGLTGNVSITTAPVPEATTWAMMLLGFGAIGLTLRSRRRTTALAQVA